jgi:hypothetical protein
MKKVVLWTLGIAAGYMVAKNMPDLFRYMKIRSM